MFGAMGFLGPMLGAMGAGNMFGGEGGGGFGQGLRDWWSGANAYNKLGGPEDMHQINPWTQGLMDQFGQQGNTMWNQMGNTMGQMQDHIAGMDPLAAQNYFNNHGAGQMRNIAAQNFDPFANEQRANYLSNRAVDNISGHFGNAGPGALRSGAAAQAISEGALNPLTEMNMNLANMQAGQAGQLQGQNMNQLFNQFSGYDQMRLGGLGQLMGQQGQTFGQLSGLQGQMGMPQWWEQSYAKNPNYMGLNDIIGAGSDIAGMIMPFMGG